MGSPSLAQPLDIEDEPEAKTANAGYLGRCKLETRQDEVLRWNVTDMQKNGEMRDERARARMEK